MANRVKTTDENIAAEKKAEPAGTPVDPSTFETNKASIRPPKTAAAATLAMASAGASFIKK